VGKKSATVDRKAKLEEVRKAQKALERRRTLLVGGAAGVVVLALIVAVGVVIRKQVQDSDMTRVGVTAAAASCDPVTNDPSTGVSDHIGPGTDFPNETTVKYATIPPSSGKHLAVPIVPARDFYTAKDRPAVETLVHNLEHGYTIVWYDASTPKAQVDELKKLSPLARDDKSTGPAKFIVAAWDESRGAFPTGKHIAFSHWGAKNGHRQLCGQVSGEAIKTFIGKYPYSDSPEPNAA
jgi:hypothetical protein